MEGNSHAKEPNSIQDSTGSRCCTSLSLSRVCNKEPDITAVIQDFQPDPVRPGDSVTLQCSVLSDSEDKPCPGEHSVFWFRAGSSEFHPSLTYAHRNRGDECEKSPEAYSPQKCVYNLSKTVSSSDAGTYYCAVATCGEIILLGNGTKLAVEANTSSRDCQRADTILSLLCAALVTSLMVIALLVYTIKKNKFNCCNAATAVLQTNATSTGGQQSQQADEDSLVYSVPHFTRGKAGRSVNRDATTVEGESIYTDVRVLG
ncbi:uncharacterized protein LOC116696563 isoform X2 [Etheostoma spectabile]|uniref:uncharacterized protein LOC116696563 isoform X2 n=1 Tax=Etheostoma spectabile TaxID=54343 RepID=UPI0013AE939C|nr:uncharacterized protein LOC116696563 isoform X2 [Etheostoma spectabile]